MLHYNNFSNLDSANLHELETVSSLQAVYEHIADDPILRSCIFDVSLDEDVLVILCRDSGKNAVVKTAIERHWNGSVEIYCPNDVVTGSTASATN